MTKQDSEQAPWWAWVITAGLLAFIVWGCVGILNPPTPTPKHPVTVTAVPRSTDKVVGHWKMGEFVIGYRIETDDHVFISDSGGLYGQTGGWGGPGLVPYYAVETTGVIVGVAKLAIADGEKMTFQGDLLHDRDGVTRTFNDKSVVLLYAADYKDQHYEVNRRP